MQPSSISQNTDLARINRLFVRFGAIYGHIWQSQFKQKDFLALAKKEWSDTLHSIEDKNLMLAIEECKKRIEMPPTLPLFYQLCRSFQVCNHIKPPEKAEFKQVTPGVATAYLSQMKEMLSQKIVTLKGVQ